MAYYVRCPRCCGALQSHVESRQWQRWLGPTDDSGDVIEWIAGRLVEVACTQCGELWAADANVATRAISELTVSQFETLSDVYSALRASVGERMNILNKTGDTHHLAQTAVLTAMADLDAGVVMYFDIINGALQKHADDVLKRYVVDLARDEDVSWMDDVFMLLHVLNKKHITGSALGVLLRAAGAAGGWSEDEMVSSSAPGQELIQNLRSVGFTVEIPGATP